MFKQRLGTLVLAAASLVSLAGPTALLARDHDNREYGWQQGRWGASKHERHEYEKRMREEERENQKRWKQEQRYRNSNRYGYGSSYGYRDGYGYDRYGYGNNNRTGYYDRFGNYHRY